MTPAEIRRAVEEAIRTKQRLRFYYSAHDGESILWGRPKRLEAGAVILDWAPPVALSGILEVRTEDEVRAMPHLAQLSRHKHY